MLGYLLWCGAAVLVPKQAQQGAGQVGGVVDGGHGVLVVERGGVHDHPAAPAVDGRIEARDAAGGQIGVPATGTGAKNANLAAAVSLGAQKVQRPGHVAHHLFIGHAPFGAHAGGHVFGRAMPGAEVEVGADGGVTVVGKFARCLTIPFVPTGHVVDDHHAGEGAGAYRPGIIRIDHIPIRPMNRHRFGQHAFILVCFVHLTPPLPVRLFYPVPRPGRIPAAWSQRVPGH